MPNQRTTGLTSQQFTTLLTYLSHHLTWGKPGGRPPALTLAQGLKATLLYHRHNLTEELLADLFDTSEPTISRGINTIEHALEKILSPLNRPLRERGLFKSKHTPHTHQLDNGPTRGKNMSVKSLQITSSHTGQDRCHTSLQPASQPRNSPHYTQPSPITSPGQNQAEDHQHSPSPKPSKSPCSTTATTSPKNSSQNFLPSLNRQSHELSTPSKRPWRRFSLR